jgi:hypothetical protein
MSKLDANWISKMIESDGRLASGWKNMARSYWRGDCVAEEFPIWETLVSGEITVWGTDLKDRGLDVIRRSYPDSEIAWCYSERAFDVRSLDGIVAPIAIDNEGCLEIEHRFRFIDGQNNGFRKKLSSGQLGQSGYLRSFPENLSFQFPNLTNQIGSEST